MQELPRRLTFSIPLTPPSVNHYVSHFQRGGKTRHVKSAETRAWERDFPLFSRQQFVVSERKRFKVTLEIVLAPSERGDIDNFVKVSLDCIAKAGMLRSSLGDIHSDASIKHLEVVIGDSEEERRQGPLTRITIEGL